MNTIVFVIEFTRNKLKVCIKETRKRSRMVFIPFFLCNLKLFYGLRCFAWSKVSWLEAINSHVEDRWKFKKNRNENDTGKRKLRMGNRKSTGSGIERNTKKAEVSFHSWEGVTPQGWKKVQDFVIFIGSPISRSCDWLGKTFLILLVF